MVEFVFLNNEHTYGADEKTQLTLNIVPLPFAAPSEVAVENGKIVGCSEATMPWADSREHK